ncbi:MAG: nucleotidyltransferase family protein [Myxococcota bacterium]
MLFLLADQPPVTPESIDEILGAYRACPTPIVLPVYEGRRGNPAVFDRETFPGLRALAPDQGARALFDRFGERILRVPVADPAIHLDVDTEEDYQRLLRGRPE